MFELPETITIWRATKDPHGVKTYTRYSGSGRHAFKQEKFTDINGSQQISESVCYSRNENFVPGAYVLFADSPSLEPTPEANDIKALSATPSYIGLKKAWF